MKKSMKYWIYRVLITLALSTTAISGAADYHDLYSNGCCEPECCDLGCCDETESSELECCNSGSSEIDYSDSECYEETATFELWVDGLIMQPCQNLRFAQTAAAPPIMDCSDYLAHWDWDFGYRVGAGIKLPCDSWSVNAEFTCFRPSWAEALSVGAGTTIRASISTGAPFGFVPAAGVSSITTRMDLDYYTCDVVVAYRSCICDVLELTPYGGFRALWLDQSVAEVRIGGGFGVAPGSKTTLTDEYAGYGLTSGLRWKFFTCYPFQLLGHVGVSGLMGSHDLNAKAIQMGITRIWISEGVWRPNLSAEGSIGALWEYCAWDRLAHLGVRYENITWSDVFDPFGNGNNTFAIHGITIRAGLSF
ncbi:hypothetical protein SCG7086_AP_00200 [Chlamydiales bacterium SCGC AG-110-P3]|nr:hypothetical protein SCG7086_AP_00200 [Chlamydiales bacterium SCGC AG-110-P3]